MVATIGATVCLHIPGFPDIPYLRIIYTPLEFIETPPPTSDHLHSPVLLQYKL